MGKAPIQPQDKYVVRLPDGLRDDLKMWAASSNRSLNAEIVYRLEQFDPMKEISLRSMQNEMDRLRAERDEAEARLRSIGPFALHEALGYALSPGLLGRLEKAANASGRTMHEEVVQALEKAYPPPRPPSELREIADMMEDLLSRHGDRPEDDEIRQFVKSLRDQADEQEREPPTLEQSAPAPSSPRPPTRPGKSTKMIKVPKSKKPPPG